MHPGLHRAFVAAVIVCLSTLTGSQSTLVRGVGKRSESGPYTARFRIFSAKTLGDGTTITHESTETSAPDSQGHTLFSITNAATSLSPEHSIFGTYDPAIRTTTRWDVPGKSVLVEQLPPPDEPGHPHTCWMKNTIGAREASSPGDHIGAGVGASMFMLGEINDLREQKKVAGEQKQKEDLGTKMFYGVEAVGERTVVTIAPGAIGNNAPIVRTTEVWRASSPEMFIRTVVDDPRTGKRTRELVEFTRGEPDPSIFLPPAEYEVKTVEWHEIPCQQPRLSGARD